MNYLRIRDSNLMQANGNPYVSSRGMQGLVLSVVFTSLSASFVAVRLYTRLKFLRRLEANDWMVVLALINSFVFMGLDIVEATSGMGMHLADIPPDILERQMKAFWLTIPFYNAAVLCAKASILMQYFRVFPTRRMRIFWDPALPGYCLSRTGLWFSNASMHIATDLAILIIPIPALIAIDIPRKQKVILMVMFALGGFVCITSIIRLTALKKIADSHDPTYDNVGAASWSAIECNTGIICACLPTLKPLLSKILPGLVSTFTCSKPTRTSIGPVKRNDGSETGVPCEDLEYGPPDKDNTTDAHSDTAPKSPDDVHFIAEKTYIPNAAYVADITYHPVGGAAPVSK
ncbi:Uncharacterized protein PECH_008618 [Penicillium ucsense]|uniref:Rhodopsin domain-containing protein n=1 Tax=Penicillium ucsense TaxID=2839758 RepID=A0A8J8WKJ8_9EURO|nr:Uncharacterized protein PECM_005193 [Penicillium ucsense]KAF7738626.1 Uncharacterized protein PECH_008618 [Penicillium ucsense]